MRAKQAVNVFIQSGLLDAAPAPDFNLSATLEAALAEQRRMRPQFAVHKNPNEATRGRFPHTRVVVPLSPAVTAKSRAMQSLTPNIIVAGREYVMVTPHPAPTL